MIVYRLCREKYAHDLSGRGAEISGGRWNGKGTAALYTSNSRALCVMEIMVHVPAGIIPKDYFLVTIEIPDDGAIQHLDPKKLPDNWNRNPVSAVSQRIGNTFFSEQKALILKAPSVIIKDEWNYILNPSHKDFKKVKINGAEPFTFDTRLFKK